MTFSWPENKSFAGTNEIRRRGVVEVSCISFIDDDRQNNRIVTSGNYETVVFLRFSKTISSAEILLSKTTSRNENETLQRDKNNTKTQPQNEETRTFSKQEKESKRLANEQL